jgi:outer membrane biosynthesis protein TonB
MTGENEQDRVVPDEERTRQILEQLRTVHAFDLAYETMVGLVNFGSQKMGLLEETREVRDLDDARLSIELVRAILAVIERGPGDERTHGLHDALAQMQLAYAHAVQLDNAERAAGREEAPASAASPAAAAASEPADERPAATADRGAAADEPEPRAAEAEPGPREEPASEAGSSAAEPERREPAAAKKPAPKPAAEKKRAKKPAEKKPAKKPGPKKKPAGEG